jgi:hypothetical protein
MGCVRLHKSCVIHVIRHQVTIGSSSEAISGGVSGAALVRSWRKKSMNVMPVSEKTGTFYIHYFLKIGSKNVQLLIEKNWIPKFAKRRNSQICTKPKKGVQKYS